MKNILIAALLVFTACNAWAQENAPVTDVMEDLFAQAQDLALWVLLALILAKIITINTPSRADDKFLDAILRGLNLFVMNVGRDKNFDAVLREKSVFRRGNGGA